MSEPDHDHTEHDDSDSERDDEQTKPEPPTVGEYSVYNFARGDVTIVEP